MGAAFPADPSQLSNEWLGNAVGGTVSGFDVEQIGIGVGLLGRLYRVTLQGEGVPATVIAKFPTLDEGARMNVVEPLRFYEKEVRFYSEAADEASISTPKAYFAEHDPASGDFALLLEDLSDQLMCDQNVGCAIKEAEIAIDALVDLHASWWASDRFEKFPWIPVYSDVPYPQVLAGMYKQAWPRALEVVGSQLQSAYRDYGERFPELIEWNLTSGAEPPVTLNHGDYRLDNMFFSKGGDRADITLVDWQICCRARGGYDLGYFISQSLSTEDRRKHESSLRDRYLEGMAKQGIEYPEEDFDSDYRRTVAWCFIYPVVATGQIEITNERHRALVQQMFDRSVQAMEDNDALELLPK
jgi:thiamine kinase-like enzyme